VVEPWANVELDGNFALMVAELRDIDAANDADINPEDAQKAAQFEQDCSELEARAAVKAIEFALQKFIHPKIKFEQELIEEAVRDFRPLLLKYGVLLPSWIAVYQEEIMALKSMGKLGMSAVAQAKRYKAEDLMIEHNEAEAA
jgi:hypothetical protein